MKIEWTGNKLSCYQKCAIKKAVKETLKELEQPKCVSVCVNIVSPQQMQEINKQTRNIDKTTDVLSFPSHDVSPFEKVTNDVSEKGLIFIGDMAINMQEVERQAKEYNESHKRALSRLVIHSILHMLGFDHISDEDNSVMEPIQDKILDRVAKK